MAECGDGDLLEPEAVIVVSFLSEIKAPKVWHKLQLQGLEDITPRLGHALIPFRSDNPLSLALLGGGTQEGALADFWTINPSTGDKERGDGDGDSHQEVKKSSHVIEGFKARYEFLCTPEAEKEKIWIFGGADPKSTFQDVGYIENGMFVEVLSSDAAKGPVSRTQGSNAAVVGYDGKKYLCVFAGGQAGIDAVQDGTLYLFDVSDHSWIQVPVQGETPPLTQGHAITAFGTKIFVYGGLNSTMLHEMVYMIDVENALKPSAKKCSWMPVEYNETDNDPCSIPPARAAFGVAQSQTKFYVSGGLGQSGCLNDLWEFSVASRTWSKIGKGNVKTPRPLPRFGLAMTFLESPLKGSEGFLFLHGGMNTQNDMYNDLWVMKIED